MLRPSMRLRCSTRGWRWGVAAAVGLWGGLGVAGARVALASCEPGADGLLWSSPANGAIDVPVDSDLFVSGQLNGLPLLAGEPLTRVASGVYDLGPLEPQTRYEVRWEGAAIVFTTGDRDASPPRAPEADVRLTRNPSGFARCPLVLPQGCFDTGPPTRVRFDAGASTAWLLDVSSCDGSVRQMVWPGACGLPVVESEDRILCISARSTQGAGLGESTGVICSGPDVPPGTLPTRSGCQSPWPPEGALTLLADDAVSVGTLSGRDAEVDEGSPGDAATPPAADAACGLVARKAGGGALGIGVLLAALAVLLRRRAPCSAAGAHSCLRNKTRSRPGPS